MLFCIEPAFNVLIYLFVRFRINSSTQIVEHREAFRTSNALEIVSKYGLVTPIYIWLHDIFPICISFDVFLLVQFPLLLP